MTPLTPRRAEALGRFRRTVALLALSAWTLSAFMCPMPDHGMDVTQTHDTAPAAGGHAHQHGQSPSHPDSDPCCQLLGDTHAIVKSVVTPSIVKAAAPSFPAVSATVASLDRAADHTAQLTPPSNGPPRNLYQRFATFWSHAPPADLV